MMKNQNSKWIKNLHNNTLPPLYIFPSCLHEIQISDKKKDNFKAFSPSGTLHIGSADSTGLLETLVF